MSGGGGVHLCAWRKGVWMEMPLKTSLLHGEPCASRVFARTRHWPLAARRYRRATQASRGTGGDASGSASGEEEEEEEQKKRRRRRRRRGTRGERGAAGR
ncbi:unnamed protein product [Prorocentrum cordatum]|uniref:Uncharacterized protein n=1 Tax=Prorocentrum cordatum TaxID=2364126 RepID=A0ABN9SEV8_9DINO|nr:unnamed protein product [Polarella glacialis]